MKKRDIVFLGVIGAMTLLSGTVSATLETDETYAQFYAEHCLKKADKNRDKQLTPADQVSWKTYAHFDLNKDDVVTVEELLEQGDAIYSQFDADVMRNLIYKKAGGETLLMDVYLPKTKGKKPFPVFYYTHGGGWASGMKEPGGDIKSMFDQLLKSGVACVSVNYRHVKMWRGSDPVMIRDCIVDCRDGLRFLKKNARILGLDAENVVVFGESAGGHIAQLLTWAGPDAFSGDPKLTEYTLQPVAGVSWFGPTDFRKQELFEVPEGVQKEYDPWHWSNRVTKYDGNIYESSDPDVIKKLEEVSPILYLTKKSAPLLQVHGDIDSVIPVKHAWALEKKAKELGAPVEVQLIKNAWHGWGNRKSTPSPQEACDLTVAYVLKQLLKKG